MKHWLFCLVIASSMLSAGRIFENHRYDHKQQAERIAQIVKKNPKLRKESYDCLLDEIMSYQADVKRLLESGKDEYCDILRVYQKGIKFCVEHREEESDVSISLPNIFEPNPFEL